MINLIQMIYITRSTFMTTELANGIEPNVARILLKSRANNKKMAWLVCYILVMVVFFNA